MKRVLFVDDEPNILSGIRRMLRGFRKEWDMHFVGSGLDGLAILEQKDFDIVISDMKMPGMDGAEFLSRVKEIYPDTIRIILSGQSEKASVMKSVGPTHQFLAKPCEPEILQATIRQAYALKDVLNNEKLQALAGSLDTIPSLPKAYGEIVAELQNPNSSLERIGKIIERDIGMSAKILKIVNSAYFGLLRPVITVTRAAAYLGLETVTALVMSAEIFSAFDETSCPGFSLDGLWNHSMATGAAARAILQAEAADGAWAEDAFTAATLHDVGTLILAGNLPEQFVKVQKMVEAGANLDEAEREVFGSTHGEVGAYLMGIWGLNNSIVEAIAFHAEPSKASSEGFAVVSVVHAAEFFASEASEGRHEADLDMEYLEKIGKADRVDAWRAACATKLEEEAEHEPA